MLNFSHNLPVVCFIIQPCIYLRSNHPVQQGCTNSKHQVTMATKFCTLLPNICGSSARNLLHVTVLAPGVSKTLLDFWKICASLLQSSNFPVQKQEYQSYARNFSQIKDFSNVCVLNLQKCARAHRCTHFSRATENVTQVNVSTIWRNNAVTHITITH
jgi:hypothetical protein